MLTRSTRLIFRFAGFYALIAIGWILLSDRFLAALSLDVARLSALQTYKGVFFVTVTTALLALVLHRLLRKWEVAATDRVRTGEKVKALSREAEHLRAALDEHAIVSITDPQGIITYVNDKFCAISRYSRTELLGQDHRIINSGYHPKEFIRGLWTTIARGRTWHGEIRNKAKDGSFYWVEATIVPFLDEQGKPTQYVSIRTEVTERKRVETEVQRLAAFAQHNPNPVLELSAAGEVNYCNAATDEMTRLLGRDHAGQILPPDTVAIVHQCLTTGSPLLRLETKVGDRTISWSFFPVPVNRTVHCYAGDVTERKQLELQFLRAQRMEAIGTLSSGVAHDLNNILAPILMGAGLLKLKMTTPNEQKILSMVEDGAQRGASIIRQLLTFSRGIDGARMNVQVRHLFKEMQHLMEETFPKNIEIEQNVPVGLKIVLADATQLHQVLMNLCVNARDAMPGGGTLSLGAENIQLDETQVRLHPGVKPGAYILMTVADTGHGIPQEIRQRIFEPFFTTKEPGKGTGLGLSTVMGIVKSHGGFITVESEPPKGTLFKVYLPAAIDAAETPAGLSVAPMQAGKGELILVVDDEVSIREALGELLTGHQFRVVTASNGEEAIRLFIQHFGEVSLVVTDISMPGMGGMALIRALRVLSPDIRLVVSSGSDQEVNQAEFIALGIKEVLGKPSSQTLMLKAVYRALAAT